MASIRERPSAGGTTKYAVLYVHNGKQTSTTFPTLKGAERFKILVELTGRDSALHQIAQTPTDVPTVVELVDTFIDTRSGITDGTRSDYRSYTRDLGDLGRLPVDALTRAAVEGWVNQLSKRLSGKSINNRKSLLSAALTRAQRDGIVSDNVAKGVRVARSIHREMTMLTEGEFADLISHVPIYWQPLVTTLVGTGMRWGEATALAVRDCDLEADSPVVRVRQAWKHTDGHTPELGPPKTRKGRRTIDVSHQVVDAIRPLLRVQRVGVDGKSRAVAADDLVFVNRQGRRVHQSTFLVHVWQPAIRAFAGDVLEDGKWKAGAGKRPRVHDLRHSHASWLIARGIPLTYIQDRLGHESISTTSDTYGHLATGAGRVSAAAIELALAQAFPVIEPPPAIDGRSPRPE